ncbi:MAG: hypothetical protein ACOYLO_09540 [Ferruginibacter sp.]
MKKICVYLFLVTGFSSSAQVQLKYTAADERAMAKAHIKLSKLHSLGNLKVYRLGLAYERWYTRYRDSNMIHALSCFEYYANSTDRSSPIPAREMAYKIGGIYEKGTGIPADTLMAMIWYRLSTPAGFKKLEVLQKTYCAKELYFTMDGNLVIDMANPALLQKMATEANSILIPFPIPCSCNNSQLAAIMAPVIKLMRDNPELYLRLTKNTDPAAYYPSFAAPKDIVQASQTTYELKKYLAEIEGIHPDRILIHDVAGQARHLPKKGIYFIEIQFMNEAQLSDKTEDVTFDGWYSYQDNIHCNTNFRFLRNGNYYLEAGCEDRSSISFGHYQAGGLDIRLQPSPDEAIRFSISMKDTAGGSWIRMVDEVGQPITAFQLMTLNGSVTDTLRDCQFPLTDTLGYSSIPSGDSMSFSFARKIRQILVSPVFKAWYPLKHTNNKIVTLQFNYPVFALGTAYIRHADPYPLLYKKLSNREFKDPAGRIFKKRND